MGKVKYSGERRGKGNIAGVVLYGRHLKPQIRRCLLTDRGEDRTFNDASESASASRHLTDWREDQLKKTAKGGVRLGSTPERFISKLAIKIRLHRDKSTNEKAITSLLGAQEGVEGN